MKEAQEVSFIYVVSVSSNGGDHFSSFCTLFDGSAILLSCPEGGGQTTAARTELGRTEVQ
jgi:hypothetical protein